MVANPQKLHTPRETSEVITVLSVSSFEDDHTTLQHMFNHRNWRLVKARSVEEARRKIRTGDAAVVICERDIVDGEWKDILLEAMMLETPPQVIVASALADEALWAEVLNLGGYDVLQKPFSLTEVMRVVSMAWRQYTGTIPSALPVPEPPIEQNSPFHIRLSAN